MTFEYGIAERSDDQAIRCLLANNPMPGAVEVAFLRDPDYFIGHGVMGDRCITIKAIDTDTNTIAAVICMAETERYVGGEPVSIGYIGQLRIDHRYRGYMIPLRASSYMKRLAADGWPDIWFTAFVDENPEAIGIFATRPRPSLPRMRPVSPITTLALAANRHYQRFAPSGTGADSDKHSGSQRSLRIVSGGAAGIDSIVRFLRSYGRSRDFYPVHRADHFTEEARTPGFGIDDFFVCIRNGDIVGVCGVWDQSSFKQTEVRGYRGSLAKLRPVLNIFAPVLGYKRLPSAGSTIRSAYVSFLAIRDDDKTVCLHLLRAAVAAAYHRSKDYLFAGFCDADPLLKVARKLRHITYRSSMYVFTFTDEEALAGINSWTKPYVEIAAL